MSRHGYGKTICPLLLLLLAFAFSPVLSVDRDTCKIYVTELLSNGTVYANDSSIFYLGQDANHDGPVLNVPSCNSLCGSGHTWYDNQDIGRRLSAWLVPVLILVGNMCLASLGAWNSLLTIVHLLGDPIDSMWSLLTKLEVFRRSYAVAEEFAGSIGAKKEIRDLATIIVAVEEVLGSFTTLLAPTQNTGANPGVLQNQVPQVVETIGKPLFDPNPNLNADYKAAASELLDHRVSEALRTYLAILSYLIALSSAFISAVDPKTTSRPGNRIAFGILFSWLIPAVLLSAAIGGFPCRRSCHRILKRLESALPEISRIPEKQFFDSQAWTGAIYSYRPNKRVFHGGSGDRSHWVLGGLAVVPIVLATTGAFVISWVTPTVGLGCRSVTELFIGVLWGLSAGSTCLICNMRWSDRVKWRTTLAKDAAIGTSIIIWVLLIECGIYNTCICWSALYSRGYANAFVELNVQVELEQKAKSTYPSLAFGTVLFQVLLVLVIHMGCRSARPLFAGAEADKQESYTGIPKKPGVWDFVLRTLRGALNALRRWKAKAALAFQWRPQRIKPQKAVRLVRR